MAWDDQKGGEKKDPWGGEKGKQQGGPPDLDAVLSKLRHQMSAAFSNKKKKGNAEPPGGGSSKIDVGPLLIAFLVVIIWFLSGIFIVSPAETSVILQFGRYKETLGSGPHWIPRFINSNYTVNIQQVSNFDYQSEMLTKDENIVSVAIAIQYRVDNAKDYLFNVVDPNLSLRQATASAVRQIVGHATLNNILTVGREKARKQVTEELNNIIKRYKMGIAITDVALQPIKPPEEVTAAFDDAIKAREDEQRFVNKAQAYTENKIQAARGKGARAEQEARGYTQQVVLNAQADTASFLALLPEYKRAPGVTSERLYLSTIETVLENSSKILVDVKGSNNLVYLPLDKIVQHKKLDLAAKANGDNTGNNTKAVGTKNNADSLPTPAEENDYTVSSRPSYPIRGGY